jgi:hypothetical protein
VLVLLVAFYFSNGRIGLALLGARPLDREDLIARFQAVIGRTRLRLPRLYRGGPTDGCWPMVVTWLARDRAWALISETVLAELSADETAALFAWNVAWLEAHDARRMLKLRVWSFALVVIAAFIGPVATWLTPGMATWATTLVPPACALLWLVVRLRGLDHARSDRRAAELCGDPELLIRALVRQAEISRITRRMTHLDAEGWRAAATSLARRIQAIRSGAPSPGPYRGAASPASEAAPADLLVPARSGGGWVSLEADRATWFDGVPDGTAADPAAVRAAARSVRSHVYEDLAALGIVVEGGGPVLLAADRDGRQWKAPLRAEDTRQVQALLDRIDTRLAQPAGDRRSGRLVTAALVGGAAATMMSAKGMGLVVLLPGLSAFLAPTAALLSCFGAATLAQGMLILAQRLPLQDLVARDPRLGLAVAGVGLLALLYAWRRRSVAENDLGHKLRRIMLWGLGALALLPLLWVLTVAPTGGARALGILQTSGQTGAVALAGVAGALVGAPRRRWRLLAFPLAALALLPIVIAPPMTGAAKRDPALDPLSMKLGPGEAALLLTEAPVDRATTRLWLSPGATRFAGFVTEQDAAHLVLGDFNAPPRSVRGREIAFLDDDRALVLAANPEGGSDLRLETLSCPAGATCPARLVAHVAEDRARGLTVDPSGSLWQLVAVASDGAQVTRYAGRIDSKDVTSNRWPARPAEGAQFCAVASGSLEWMIRSTDEDEERPYAEILDLTTPGAVPVITSNQLLSCLDAFPGDRGCTCLAHQAGESSLWSIEPASGAKQPLGTIPAIGLVARMSRDGKLIVSGQGELVIVDLGTPGTPTRRLRLPADAGVVGDIAPAAGAVGVLVRDLRGTRVAVYRR